MDEGTPPSTMDEGTPIFFFGEGPLIEDIEAIRKLQEANNSALVEMLYAQDGRVLDKEYEIDLLKSEIKRLSDLLSSHGIDASNSSNGNAASGPTEQ